MEKGDKSIRIIDIARLAGVSAGTVDRVIHNRGKVSTENQEKVEKVLGEIGYAPNLAARALASKKEYPIAVIAPSYEGESYWKMVGEGIGKAAGELGQFNVTVDFFRFDQYDRDSFPTAVPGGREYKGFIIATLFEQEVKELSARLDERKIPYVYIDSVIEGQNDLAYFGVDAFQSGYIAGKLMAREAGPQADILVAHIRFSRNEISMQMRAREEGMLKYLQESGHWGGITHLELNPETPAASVKMLERYLSGRDGKVGAIVLNSRVYQLAAMLEKADPVFRRKVVVTGFEAIAPNVEALKKGDVRLLISQRPELQGYDAVKALGNFFLYGRKPARINFMPIDIVLPENADYYYNYKL